MNELYNNILLFQNGDNKGIEYIINKFDKLLNSIQMSFNQSKFFNKYDIEDNRQDLILSLINIVKNIKLSNPGFDNEGCLVNYIHKSLLHSRKYMYVNKNIKKDFIMNKYLSSMVEAKDEYCVPNIESNFIIYDLLKCLTEKEKMVIEYKFIKDKSEVEIGEILNISRQSINKTKNRALKKLKNYYLNSTD